MPLPRQEVEMDRWQVGVNADSAPPAWPLQGQRMRTEKTSPAFVLSFVPLALGSTQPVSPFPAHIS